MNTILKVLSLFHGNLNALLHVLYKIKHKINVKTKIAQNLSYVKLDINVLKCFTKGQNFVTLISSLIQDKSASFLAVSVFTYILFFIMCSTCKRTFKFQWN